MEQLLVMALLPAINAVVRSTPAKNVRQNGENTATQTDIGTQTEISDIETPTKITNLASESLKDSQIAQKPITNNLIEQETFLSPAETSSTDLESLNLDKRSLETSHLSVPSDTEVLMEIYKSSLPNGQLLTLSKGKVVEKLLTELDLTLLNDGSNTYFHSATQSFSAIELSICSPSLLLDLTWSVLDNPLGSDHFPVVMSYATQIACATIRQPRWKFDQADWETFRTQADITEDMVSSGSIDEVVSLVTSCILSAANNEISQPSSRLPRFPKPWWNEEYQIAKKDQNKAWNRF
ncbi:putative tick transposon [Trichonephila clavipes]|nr:putative tick transposon [Trichonephila clavipes]